MTLRNDGRLAMWWRKARVAGHQGLRLAGHARYPERYPPPVMAGPAAAFPYLHGRREVTLLRDDPAAHPVLEAGKRWNLQLAAPVFDGLLLSRDRPLSFWRTLGRITAARGFRHGMELRGGCIMPALGGGLCLLSNALFELAAWLGWRIDERHGHTLEAVPPHGVWGLDATLFWPYVDLRVAPRDEVRLSVQLVGDVLVVAVQGRRPPDVRVQLEALDDEIGVADGVRTRHNRVVRRVFDATTGVLREQSVIANNRKQLLHSTQQARNCLTCQEFTCMSRVELSPEQMVLPART